MPRYDSYNHCDECECFRCRWLTLDRLDSEAARQLMVRNSVRERLGAPLEQPPSRKRTLERYREKIRAQTGAPAPDLNVSIRAVRVPPVTLRAASGVPEPKGLDHAIRSPKPTQPIFEKVAPPTRTPAPTRTPTQYAPPAPDLDKLIRKERNAK